MKNYLRTLLATAAVAVVIGTTSYTASAQNFDPAQFRERMMTRYREQLDVKSDDDWKKLEPLVGKVMDARTAAGGAFGGRGGFGRGRGDGGGGGGGGDQARNNRPRGSEEEQALEKAIEDKASPEEVKAKLAALRQARKAKEAELEKAQEELRKALNPRQEAAAVLARLIK